MAQVDRTMNGFENHGLKGGTWSGLLHTSAPPARVRVTVQGTVVAEVRVTEQDPGQHALRAEIPGSVLSDGLVTLVMQSDDGSEAGGAVQVLGRQTLLSGQPLAEDVLAEIASLRDELDLLKSEFRRFAGAARSAD